MNIDILDMAASYKVVIRQEKMKRETEKDVTDEDAIVVIVADVQEEQDKECEMVLEQIQGKVSENMECEMFLEQIQGKVSEDKECQMVLEHIPGKVSENMECEMVLEQTQGR